MGNISSGRCCCRDGGGLCQHNTCLFPCSEYKFTAERSWGPPAKDDLLLFQNRAEKSLSVLHTHAQHAAFPGKSGERFGNRQ